MAALRFSAIYHGISCGLTRISSKAPGGSRFSTEPCNVWAKINLVTAIDVWLCCSKGKNTLYSISSRCEAQRIQTRHRNEQTFDQIFKRHAVHLSLQPNKALSRLNYIPSGSLNLVHCYFYLHATGKESQCA